MALLRYLVNPDTIVGLAVPGWTQVINQVFH